VKEAECPVCHGTGKIGTTDWLTKDMSAKQLAKEKEEAVAEFNAKIRAEAIKEVFDKLEERLCVLAFKSASEDYVDGMSDCIEWVDGKIDELKKEMGCGE
jgi:hypothetical protein